MILCDFLSLFYCYDFRYSPELEVNMSRNCKSLKYNSEKPHNINIDLEMCICALTSTLATATAL